MKVLTIVTSAYRSANYIRIYFESVLRLNSLESLKVILVLNDPDNIELQVSKEYQSLYPDLFNILKVPRETIGASLNRGFNISKTPYTAYLDIDDQRVPDSFDRQIATLESNPDVDFTYGDIMVVSTQGETEGRYVLVPEFDSFEFTRSCIASPTQLFRTHLLKKLKGFDEQLKSGGDFDFNIRAASNCKFKKTPGLLCYYTKFMGSGSASSNDLQPIERTVIELRYGIFDKIDYRYIKQAREYNISNILINGDWLPISQFIHNYESIIKERKYLKPIGLRKYRIAQFQRQISHGKKFVKNLFRFLVNKIGLYNVLIPVWRKLIK
jgi:glycosyltransferase involved in cell wall biosynthesis